MEVSPWKRFSAGGLTLLAVLGAIDLLLNLADWPKRLQEWGAIFGKMNEASIRSFLIVCAVVLLVVAAILVALQIVWLFRKRTPGITAAGTAAPTSDATPAPADDPPDVGTIAKRIDRLADEIPIPADQKKLGELLTFGLGDSIRLVMNKGGDWKTETKYGLRGLVKREIFNEYEKCLRSKRPEIAAVKFLRSLAASLKASDLRN